MKTERQATPPTADASYVLPSPPRLQSDRQPAELLVERAGRSHDRLPATATSALARAFGTRLHLQAESLGLLLGELRERIVDLDGAATEASPAQLKGALRQLGEVLDWCDAVRVELVDDGRNASRGLEPVDLGELCRLQVGATGNGQPPTEVRADDNVVAWGLRRDLALLIDRAVQVVRARIASGLVRIEVTWCDAAPAIRVVGLTDAGVQTSLPEDLRSAFRRVVERVGAVVEPGDEAGAGGASLLLRLPASA